MKSFKTKSYIVTILTTAVVAALTYIASMNPDQLATNLGIYGSYAPLIIVICASIVNQISENKRVDVAEKLVLTKDKPTIGFVDLQEDIPADTDEIEVEADDDSA